MNIEKKMTFINFSPFIALIRGFILQNIYLCTPISKNTSYDKKSFSLLRQSPEGNR